MNDVPLKKQPKELISFIPQSNMSVSLLDKETWRVTDKDGHYAGSKKTTRTAPVEIVIYYKREELKPELDELIKRRAEGLDYQDIYFKMYYKFTTSLMHELQHAWDDYRSRGRAFQTKQRSAFHSKYPDNKLSNLDQTAAAYKYKDYLNLPDETWAHFTQTFKDIHFTSTDFTNDNGEDKIVTFMKPLVDVVKKFRYQFPKFKILNPETQQRLLKAIVSYWHKAKEELEAQQKLEKSSIQESIKGDVNVDFATGKIMSDGNVVGVAEITMGRYDFMLLDKIVIYDEYKGQGIGTAAMMQIIDHAKNDKKVLALTPDNTFGGNKNKLIKWYRSLGFIQNKGKNKDFRTMQAMYLPLS